MSRKVYINRISDGVECAVTYDGSVEEYYRFDNAMLTGTVYRGKVVSATKIGVYVDIGREKNGFLTYREGLNPGDFVTVAAEREEFGQKGCLVSENVRIAGRYAVICANKGTYFSKKLNETEREQLTAVDCGAFGCIYRSACKNTDLEVIQSEVNSLRKKLSDVYAAADNFYRVSRLYVPDVMKIAENTAYSNEEIVYGFRDIRTQISAIFGRKVELNGVELVFERTDAFMAVDVNAHRFRAECTDAETAMINANLIAVKLLAKHLRLRNIGGVIVVDFITMKDPAHKAALLDALNEELKKDSVKCKAEMMDSLCIAAITRQKRYSSI